MSAGIRQVRAAGGDVGLLPADSAGAEAGRFLGLVAASSAGGPEVRAAQSLDLSLDLSLEQLAETYEAHYRSLLRLAALLLDDLSSCEDVVQEAFIRVHAARSRIREPERILAYLRQTVVNLSRATLRRRNLGPRLLPEPLSETETVEDGSRDALDRDTLMHALRELPRRQREVMVLCYYVDMTETEAAASLGISAVSVRAHRARGLAALRKLVADRA
ncbi:SigE family RNA polymerase sigma factor [Kitasatospora purpeofusca]|uniref:SigE family RNA polymerase sigma factor n=1 Tax=Kitasatospora purpeofusca TaxID=67352 RepID=UPI003F4AC42D